jgi:Arc/MetJ family transcription regulator
MARTNVDVDEKACAEVMRRFGLTTKRAAVNFALRTLAAEPLSVDEARRMRGTGWEGDLAEMRAARVSWSEHGHSVTQLPHHEAGGGVDVLAGETAGLVGGDEHRHGGGILRDAGVLHVALGL